VARARAQRGFTLLELMTVVVIITIIAVLAVPAVAGQMKERRSRQATAQIADFYRGARMRALGRGTAVLVRFKHTSGFAQGGVEVWEATTAGPGCELAALSCQTNTWPAATVRASTDTAELIDGLNIVERGEFGDVDIAMRNPGGAPAETLDFLDVCFTPLGATYTRTVATATMAVMAGVPVHAR
jgi:type IV fimbrial biogenesis protein FimT